MRDNVINFILFQIGWFACVLGAAAQKPGIGVVIAGLVIGLHLWRAPQPRREIYLLLVAMVIGAAWDSLLVSLAWLEYPAGMLIPDTAPYWIVVLWALFATTLNVSLRWLKQRYLLAAVLGAIAGPLAYSAGAGFGALQFTDVNNAFMALAIGWAVFTPVLVAISSRMDGYSMSRARELSWI